MGARTVAWYEDNAVPACDRYEAADLPDLYARLLRCLPPPGADLDAVASPAGVLVRPGGVLFIDVSLGRPGLVADRDGSGRLFRERPSDEYRALFERHGFTLVEQHVSTDSRSRRHLGWVSLAFRAPR